jgi:hypothetical protein
MIRVGTSYLAQIGHPVPIGQLPTRAQLARPLHRDVDGGVDVIEAAVHWVRPVRSRHAQHVMHVEWCSIKSSM